jgi:hypothetical protein
MSDTSETDAAIKDQSKWMRPFVSTTFDGITYDSPVASLCRKLERERDEAREEIKELIYIAERAIALAEIDFENDKFGVVSELRDGVQRIKERAK